jgi:hypothetical protein
MSRHRVTSASCPFFPSKRTFIQRGLHVRFVPETDILSAQVILLFAVLRAMLVVTAHFHFVH